MVKNSKGKQKAREVKDFIQSLTHTKGRWAGKPFHLLDWQDKLIDDLFGTLDKNGFRQYRECFTFIGKKNGKSELGAAIALYMLAGDGEFGAEIYSAASDRNQARIVFDVAAQMVRQSEGLSKRLKIIDSVKRIVYYQTNSFYEVLSSDVKTKHGLNPHAVIFDELHAQPNRELWDVLTEGSMEARQQPLLFVMTTAGFDKESVCYEVYEYAKKVRDGVVEDKHYLPVIYEIGEEDNWEDEANWYKANPSLGTKKEIEAGTKILDIVKFREAHQKAKEIPAKINNFKRLRLNIWTSQETLWLPSEAWTACAGYVNPNELVGLPCYAGMDLSSTGDITAFVLVFEVDDIYKVLPFFFIPQDNMMERSRRDRVFYDVWVKKGFIFATEGNVIDYQFIFDKICTLAKTYEIKEIAIDPYNALMLNQKLADEGFDTLEIRQGMKSLSPPTKELETLILGKRIHHGNNPVLRWMFENVMIITDENDNRRPDKKKSREKIDGIVALIMAISRAMVHKDDTRSVYDDRNILVI
jgi:phage terminase large subunit-like protein